MGAGLHVIFRVGARLHAWRPTYKKALVSNCLMFVDMNRQEQCKGFTNLRMHILCHVHVITHCTVVLCNVHATNVTLLCGVSFYEMLSSMQHVHPLTHNHKQSRKRFFHKRELAARGDRRKGKQGGQGEQGGRGRWDWRTREAGREKEGKEGKAEGEGITRWKARRRQQSTFLPRTTYACM